MSRFLRPENLTFPQIYHRFQARDKGSDELIEYRIQDLLEEDYEKAIEIMAADYSPEESFSRCRGIPDNQEAFEEVQNLWRLSLPRKLSVGCYKSGSDELIGVNILDVYVKDQPESSIKVSI